MSIEIYSIREEEMIIKNWGNFWNKGRRVNIKWKWVKILGIINSGNEAVSEKLIDMLINNE